MNVCKICAEEKPVLNKQEVCGFCQKDYFEDPYVCFDTWMRTHGYADVSACIPENVDLERLHQAIKGYYHV